MSFSVINEALRHHPRYNKILKITVNGNTFKNKVEVTNAFNEYFSETGTSLAGNFRDSTNYLFFMTNQSLLQQNFELTPLTLSDLQSILKLLKSSSPGCDGIPIKFFKDNFDML